MRVGEVEQHGEDGPSGPSSRSSAISIRGLTKHYGGVQALNGVDFEAAPGSVHAVVGENGAGKSTLMKVLAGSVRPDGGSIALGEEVFEAQTPHTARERGIGIVYQELSLFPNRSVLANLFVNHEPRRHGLVSTKEMADRAAPVLAEIGLEVDLDKQVGFLPIGEQQLVELCRVLLSEPLILILDEPNSALSEEETGRLFAVLRRLTGGGITVLYVSHRLEEVFEIADRITVMRNGEVVLTEDRANLTMRAVVEAMIGRKEHELYPERPERSPESRARSLRVEHVSLRRRLYDVSFEARAGEIVGLAGIEGSGVSDLLGVLFGSRRADAGTAIFPDGSGLPRSATAAARRRISLVPADRRHQGLMLASDVARNIAHVSAGALRRRSPWLPRRDLAAAANRQIENVQIKTPSPWAQVHQLSGGNQQKIVIGKWLEIEPEVILLDDPARGVDVGAKSEIFRLVRRVTSDGRIVLLRSTELPELLGLCDRILVFYRGRIVADRRAESFSSRSLLHAINTGEAPENQEAGIP
ncbi:MAG: sugar ABC transporter ATP-binding protein [Gaiellaceae bacterium]